MTTAQRIEERLARAFAPAHLEVIDESRNHNVPDGAETHFKVVVVSDRFAGERLLGRHRAVNTALAEELTGGVHALAMHTYTQAEWRERFGDAPMSPPCRGGDGSLR